jgi:hypothetical protein
LFGKAWRGLIGGSARWFLITTAGDLLQAARADGRLGGSTDDNFGPGTGRGLFYA